MRFRAFVRRSSRSFAQQYSIQSKPYSNAKREVAHIKIHLHTKQRTMFSKWTNKKVFNDLVDPASKRTYQSFSNTSLGFDISIEDANKQNQFFSNNSFRHVNQARKQASTIAVVRVVRQSEKQINTSTVSHNNTSFRHIIVDRRRK